MDREELAALLAQAHSSPHSYSPTTTHSFPSTSPVRRERPPKHSTSPLSPRQIFQSRFRTLSDDANLPTNPTQSPTRREGELQYLYGLRVHVRDPDVVDHTHQTRTPRQYRSKDGRFGFGPAEPDFVAEERAAWTTERSGKKEIEQETTAAHKLPDRLGRDIETLELEQGEDHRQQHAPTLRPFGPVAERLDPDDRPKTSRGRSPDTDSLACAFPQEARGDAQEMRRSKFLEGSMSERSVGVASTWIQHDLKLSESSLREGNIEDSDATPCASRASRDSGSFFDVSEFRPQPINPSTIRGKLARLVKRSSEDASKPPEVERKPRSRGLRKSISTWSFHNIGDKVKFFGASSSDLPGGQESPHKDVPNAPWAELNERKRKAEEAYAQQFGMKKQKSNNGIPVLQSNNLRTAAESRTLERRFVSERTITPGTATHRRRELSESTTASTLSSLDPAEIVIDSDRDRRKRASRSELEKENRHLRAMLREQQAQRYGAMHRLASKSSTHLPIEDDNRMCSARSASRSTTPANSYPGTVVPAKNTKQKQSEHKGTTPVPALPSRTVFASLGSNSRNIGAPRADTGTMKQRRTGFPRPVSMIMEEDVEDEKGEKEEISSQAPTRMLPQPSTHAGSEGWEWPDDVF